MRLHKSTSHAIRILIDCARAETEFVKVADISARLGITLQNVFKIVHILSNAGLVEGQRGPKGGIKLARPPSKIYIGDVVRAMQPTNMEMAHDDGDEIGVEGVNRVLGDAFSAFTAILDTHTLAEMMSTPRRSAAKKGKFTAVAPRGPMARPPASKRTPRIATARAPK